MNREDPAAVYADAFERIARNMRRFRLRRQWTQEVAAGLAGLGVRHWQKIEASQQNVSVETLVKIAIGLGLEDWTELLKEPPAFPPLRQDLSQRAGALTNPEDPVAVYRDAFERIARNMRRLRLCRQWTQAVAAGFASVGARHWQRIEVARENVSVEILVKIAIGLGLEDWAELMKEPPAIPGLPPWRPGSRGSHRHQRPDAPA
jgi:transcriptional regulator with XRE-family HTH domain